MPRWLEEKDEYITEEFKNQMVQLYLNGKRRADVLKEYDLRGSAFDKWVRQSENSDLYENVLPIHVW